jgi:putative MATE family efflux protein
MNSSSAQSDARHGRDLTTGSIPRLMIAFTLPMLAGTLLQTAYSFINVFWVGRYLGTEALAAITMSLPVIFALLPIGAGLTMATGILVAQHFGARNMRDVRRVVDSSTVLIGAVSLLLTIVGQVLAPQIIHLLGTSPDVHPLAVGYLRIMLLSLPFGFGMFLARSTLQGIGDSTTPLYFVTVSVALTAILDPILMFGWLGFPRLGLNGTAWATLFTHVAALAALILYMHWRKTPVSPAWRNLQVDWATTWTTIRIGVPAAMQQSLVSIGMLFVIGLVNSYGTTATAAFGVASRIDQLAFMPAMTFSMAISTLTGQNIGAGKMHRIREIFGWGVVFSSGFTVIASLLAIFVPHAIMSLFAGETAVIEMGADYLRIVGIFYLFFAFTFACNGIINGAGHTLVTTVISLVSLWVVRVPFAYLLSSRLDSVNGIWYAIAASFVASMLVSMAFYLSGYWKRPIINRQPPPAETAIPAEEAAEV